jgi:hypothetical protein
MSVTNGTASPTIHRALAEAIEMVISADNRVRIVFVNVGDEDIRPMSISVSLS